jgi:hypothetical protein
LATLERQVRPERLGQQVQQAPIRRYLDRLDQPERLARKGRRARLAIQAQLDRLDHKAPQAIQVQLGRKASRAIRVQLDRREFKAPLVWMALHWARYCPIQW